MGTAEWGSLPSYLPLSLPSTDSEWAIYEIVPGFSIKIAICFSAFNFAYRDILMTAAGKTREWSKSWSMILDKESNTDEAEAYLGLDLSRQAVADRGILELQIKTDTPYTPRRLSYEGLTSLPAGKVSPDELTASALEREMTSVLGSEEDGNITISLCRFCSVPSDGTVVNEEYNSLFSNLVFGDSRRAGRAADALHAFLSVVGLNIYYQFLSDTMDVAEQVGLATTRMVTVPGSWPPSISHYAGLIVVAILLAAYLTIVLVITMLYVRYTRYSRYANIWHVISQLTYAEELKDTLELGNNAGDDAVIDSLRRGLLEDEVLVKLGKADGCGKIKVKRI